jgi:hypothetical protein
LESVGPESHDSSPDHVRLDKSAYLSIGLDGEWSPRVTFVTDGAERALNLAQEAAGDGVTGINGAVVAQQLLRLRKLDEIQVSGRRSSSAPVCGSSRGSTVRSASSRRVVTSDGVTPCGTASYTTDRNRPFPR